MVEMNDTEIIELDNGEKYAIISSINYDNKEYILVSEMSDDEQNISEELDIFIRTNEFIRAIEEENEYNLLKEAFEKKLES